MSMEKILQALEAKAGQQVAEIEAAAQAEIEHIRATGQVEAEDVRQRQLLAMAARLAAERTRQINQAKREALYLITETREALINAALAGAADRLAGLPTTPLYPRWLRQLTVEAVAALGRDQPLHLRVRPADVSLMEQIARELNLSASVEGNLPEPNGPCPIGLVAATANERIRLVNTASVRLQRTVAVYRAQIAGHLFGLVGED